MSGEQIINAAGQEIINADGTARVAGGDTCGSTCGCEGGGGGGRWFYASPCCGDDGTVCLAYPSSEPSLFDVASDPPAPAVFIWEGLPGRCFSMSPMSYPDLLAGCTPITFAEITQQLPSCDDPGCGPPCPPKPYKALIPCCPVVGNQQPPVLYIDCDQAFLAALGAGSVEIGNQCYQIHDFNCDSFTSPPPNYLPPPYSGYTIHQDCAECCTPPVPPGCPADCTPCSNTYHVSAPPTVCFVPDPNGCVEPSPPLCVCPDGDCTYTNVAGSIPINKQFPAAGCIWQGAHVIPNGTKQSGCCVPDQNGHAGTKFNDLEQTATVGCDADGFGNPQWIMSAKLGPFMAALYQRNTPPTTEGCPVGTYVKVMDLDSCPAPNTLEVG